MEQVPLTLSQQAPISHVPGAHVGLPGNVPWQSDVRVSMQAPVKSSQQASGCGQTVLHALLSTNVIHVSSSVPRTTHDPSARQHECMPPACAREESMATHTDARAIAARNPR